MLLNPQPRGLLKGKPPSLEPEFCGPGAVCFLKGDSWEHRQATARAGEAAGAARAEEGGEEGRDRSRR